MGDDKEVLNRLGAVFLDSYFVVDQTLRITAFNPAFAALVGLRGAEAKKIIGAHCHELLKLEICGERCIARAAISKQGPVRLEEIRGERADGSAMTLELSAVPVRNAAGEIDGVLVTHRDLSDERRLKDRYLAEQRDHGLERTRLLRVIEERDGELEKAGRR